MSTALFSVYDKSGVAEFAAALHRLGWRIVSSGGTAREIAAAGVEVTDVAQVKGLRKLMDLLDDLDDVQDVHGNMDVSDELMDEASA